MGFDVVAWLNNTVLLTLIYEGAIIMGFLGKLFGGHEKQSNMLEKVQDIGGRLIVDGYRKLGKQAGLAPTAQTSDDEIIEMYKKVGTAFHMAAEARGERLSVGVKNGIVFKFLQLREMLGEEMIDSHLAYEVEKYVQSGLREDYREEIKLF